MEHIALVGERLKTSSLWNGLVRVDGLLGEVSEFSETFRPLSPRPGYDMGFAAKVSLRYKDGRQDSFYVRRYRYLSERIDDQDVTVLNIESERYHDE